MTTTSPTDRPQECAADRPQECAPYVHHVGGQRYPYVPTCPCGWRFRGFVAEHAAQTIADAHRDGDPLVAMPR